MALLGLGPRRYALLQSVEPMFLDEESKTASPTEPLLDSVSVALSDIYAHVSTLYMLTVEKDLKTVLELGTRGGASTVAFLAAAKKIGGHVYSIDIDPCNEAKARISRLGLDEYWTFTQADDLKTQWQKPIDHLFIDTLHTYEHTTAELDKYGPSVRPDGIVTLHDLRIVGVRNAVEDYVAKNPGVRLYQYWNNNGLGIIFHT